MVTNMKNITFVTSNENKLREARAILEVELERADVDLDEIQEMDLSKIIEHKVRQAYAELQKPVIVEDVGLYVSAWNGFPGPFVKWMAKTIGFENIPSLLRDSNRAVDYVVMYGFFDGGVFKAFEGRVKGAVAESPRGTNGFGFDIFFIPDGRNQTYAEMAEGEKNKISARSVALKNLHDFLVSKN